MDASAIGTFGTLKLLKSKTKVEESNDGSGDHDFVASFPIDDDELTFGRNPDCGVRLYYPTVSMMHCKLVFKDRKAFILVYGSNGITLDGCQVFPVSHTSPTTVPILNGAIIEIQKKRFQFNYPPKHHRSTSKALLPIGIHTPAPKQRRRSLRMSMVASAEVFTPNPKRSPRKPAKDAKLEMLQTPLKTRGNDDGIEMMITMMEAQENSVVIEEEKDIIVLESVETTPRPKHTSPPELAFTPLRHAARPAQATPRPHTATVSPTDHLRLPTTPSVPTLPIRKAQTPKQPSTPNNRRRSEPSLHKAVLLRSAQRAMERKKEEEREEMEVEESVSPVSRTMRFAAAERLEEDDSDGDSDGEGEEMPPFPVAEEVMDEMLQEKMQVMAEEAMTLIPREQEGPQAAPIVRSSTIRKSLELVRNILPFGWSSSELPQHSLPGPAEAPKNAPVDIDIRVPESPRLEDADDFPDDDEDEEDDEVGEIQTARIHAAVGQRGTTPQRPLFAPSTPNQQQISLPSGNGGARRVPIIGVSPAPGIAHVAGDRVEERGSNTGGAQRIRVSERWNGNLTATPTQAHNPVAPGSIQQTPIRVSDEERDLILNKRKSMRVDEIFTPLPAVGDWASKPAPSPMRPLSSAYEVNEDKDVDTNELLARVKAQAGDMRRKSLARQAQIRNSLSPKKPVFGLGLRSPIATPNFSFNLFSGARTPAPGPEGRKTSEAYVEDAIQVTDRKASLDSVEAAIRVEPVVTRVTSEEFVEGSLNATTSGRKSSMKFVEDAIKVVPAPSQVLEDVEEHPESFGVPLINLGSDGGDGLPTHRFDDIQATFGKGKTSDGFPAASRSNMASPSLRTPRGVTQKPAPDTEQSSFRSGQFLAEEKVDIHPEDEESEMKESSSLVPAKGSRRGRSGSRSRLGDGQDESTTEADAPPHTRKVGSRRAKRDTSTDADDKGEYTSATTSPAKTRSKAVGSTKSSKKLEDEVMEVDEEVPESKKTRSRGASKLATRKKVPPETTTVAPDDDELDGLGRPASPETVLAPRTRSSKIVRAKGTSNAKEKPVARGKGSGSKTDTEMSDEENESKAKGKARAATTGRAAGRKLRSKTASVLAEEVEEDDKENSPQIPKATVKRGRRVAATTTVGEVEPAARKTRTRSRK